MTRYVNPGSESIHLWEDREVDWIEPETGEDHGDPVGPALCGAVQPGFLLDELRSVYDALRDFTGDPDACPECVALLAQEHNLPPAYLTAEARAERERLDEADAPTIDEIRDAVEQVREHGASREDITVSLPPAERDALRSETAFAFTDPTSGAIEVDGIPVLASADVEDLTVSVETVDLTPSIEDFEVEVEMDLDLKTEAIEKAAQEMAEQAKEMTPTSAGRRTATDLPPVLHPMSRSEMSALEREDGTPITWTGTCVKTDPVTLDDGEMVAEVTDTSVLGEDARLGREYEVPAEAMEVLETGEDSEA